MPDRIRRTPSIGLSGIYTAVAPFILSEEFTYKCIAIRRFLDVEKEDILVFETYYQPKDLDNSIYAEDEANDVCIITLQRSDGLLFYIPDSFLASIPLQVGLNYVRLSLMIDCGIVREGLDITFVENQIISLVKQVVNPPTVEVSRILLPVKNSIAVVDQDTLEATRVANVNMSKTDYARMKELETQLNAARQIIESQNQKLIDAGVPV